MNLIRRCIIILVILGFINKGFSQENTTKTVSNSFTLEEAVKYAVENGYDVKAKKIDLEIAKKKIWETTAIGLPQVSGSIAYQHTFVVPEMNFGSYLDPTELPAGVPLTQADIISALMNDGLDPVRNRPPAGALDRGLQVGANRAVFFFRQ